MIEPDRILKLELQIAALRIGLSELLLLLIERKVLEKQEVVTLFQGLGDVVMPISSGDIGTKVFEQIANYVLEIPTEDD